MKIKVKISRTKDEKEIQMEKGSTVLDLLKELNFKPDNVVVMSGKTPIAIDDPLKDKQEIAIIQVFSGG